MKKIKSFVFAIFLIANAIAQEDTIRPQFPGGDDAIYHFLMTNLQYPEEARNNNICGNVLVGFDIDTTGEMVNIHVMQSVAPILDNEALRVCMAMPRWEPATYNGKKIKFSYVIPFSFTINPMEQPKRSKKKSKSPRH